MSTEELIQRRTAAEQPTPVRRRGIEKKKLVVAGVATATFAAFLWFALGDSGPDMRSGVRVDALRQANGDRYGLLRARGPGTEEPTIEEIAPETRVASLQPQPVVIQSPAPDNTDAIAAIQDLNRQITDLRNQLTRAKVELTAKDGELKTTKLSLDRLQNQFDAREKRFQAELIRAVAEAEARTLAIGSQAKPGSLSEEEKKRLEELMRQRERQNRSDGIVFDANPYGRKK